MCSGAHCKLPVPVLEALRSVLPRQADAMKMAAAVADAPMDADAQWLRGKREAVHDMFYESLYTINMEGIPGEVEYTCSRDGVVFFGLRVMSTDHIGVKHYQKFEGDATDDEWNRVLSEGLGAKFNLNWSHSLWPLVERRMVRLGEPLFHAMKDGGLNPVWDGTQGEGAFTITAAVPAEDTKIALAMSLHPRLGAMTPLSLVSSLALILVASSKTVGVRFRYLAHPMLKS